MTDANLLSCPFCGGAAKPYHDTSGDYERQWTWGVFCENDDECIGGGGGYASRDAAVAAWNKRSWSAAMAIVYSVHSAEFTPTTVTITDSRNISSSSSSTTICVPVGWKPISVIPDDGNLVES